MRIRESGKIKKIGIFAKSFFNGEYWVGDPHLNVASVEVVEEEILSGPELELEKLKKAEAEEMKKKLERELELEKEIERELEEADILLSGVSPNGYIKFILKDTDTSELFLEHNMTIKYVSLKNKNYIKGFILGNAERDIDCYGDGENEYLIIKKIKKDGHKNVLSLIIKEKNGQKQVYKIVNGILED